MGNAVLIVVSGPPGAGKTTLAKRIAEEFRLPLITKDGIKESLFDSLGTGDREWSKKLGFASYGIMWYFLESLLRAGNPLIVESNFRPADSKKFLELQKTYAFKPFQVYCEAPADVMLERYRKRNESGGRHPGHLDDIVIRELEKELPKGGYKPLDIGGGILRVDTTDFDKIDYDNLYLQIRRFIDA